MSVGEVAVVELEQKASALVTQAKALKIVDQQTYELASEHLLGVVDLRHEIEQHHGPLKRAAHQAWQAIINAEKRLLTPVELAEHTYKTKIAEFEAEQRRIEAEARCLAEAEARRLAEEQRERELEQAEAEGADAEEIESMINAPLVVAPPRVEPAFQQAKGVTVAANWRGEVTSFEMLVRAVAAGKASIGLLLPNTVAINQLARAVRNTLAIPGIRFFSEPVVRAGRR
jgi:hypothetical protein